MKKVAVAASLIGWIVTGCDEAQVHQEPPHPELQKQTVQTPVSPSREWKTNGEINYSLVSFEREPEYENNPLAEKVRTLIENHGFIVDRVWVHMVDVRPFAAPSTSEGKRVADILVGIKERRTASKQTMEKITSKEAIVLYNAIKKNLKADGAEDVGLTVAWWNKGDRNTYTIQLSASPSGQVDVINYYTWEGIAPIDHQLP